MVDFATGTNNARTNAHDQASAHVPYNKGLCDVAPAGDTDCSLGERRKEMIDKFHARAAAAQNSFRDAVGDVRTDMLLSKGDEGSWLTMMLMDVAFGHVTRVAGVAAKAFVRCVNPSAAADTLEAAGAAMKSPGKAAQKAAEAKLKQDPAHKTKQSESQSWLMSMVASADASFQAFSEGAPAGLDDAGIMRLVKGMSSEHHSREMYAGKITAQLARFHSSGVPKIGRSNVADGGVQAAWDIESSSGSFSRDTRVVWYSNRIAGTRELVYEHADGPYRGVHPKGQIALKGGLASEYEDATYGAESERQRFGAAVPGEFRSAAIARHQQMWGEPPPEVELSLAGKTTRKPGVATPAVPQEIHDIFVGGE